ncbi:S-adenosyl-L-methionine-dependent methyltransferase [Aspergillus tamarii]|uniref:S-adenosyl-L-methionine-dependent methyltransferase n=1 Tax=Aspergillus tamarii TaxID=41984 RepID=A0A5N6V8T9_ASPTM|nr:S-adenosyl-L-methionine-dependent methyltransferase [Aspergillus tamarii]
MAAIPLQEYIIEAESQLSDIDSPTGDSDVSSFTTSIASSIKNYVYENGRRYHAFREGEYLFPNDETEQARMDMLHHIYRLILRGDLYKAPIPQSPRRILDIGTGTGIYAIDIADEFPSAEVLGIDLSPIQLHWVPQNCKFVVDDVEAEWAYPETKQFDYIHQRNMAGSISDWSRLFQQAFHHIRPGGWIEMQEFRVWFYSQDGELSDESYIRQWNRHLVDGMNTFGKPINIVEALADKLKAVGFVGVREDVLKVPVGPWPKDPRLKELGQWMQIQTMDAIEPLSLALFTRVLGWTEQESRILFSKVQKEFKETKKQLYVYTHFIYGRKPEV